MAAKTITVSKAEFPVSFSGVEGAGTASVSGTKKGVTVGAATPASGLSNGATVTVAFTPVTAGDTINPSSLTYTVAGLTAAPATGGTDVADFKDGKELRDGTATTDAKYKDYKEDVTEGQTVQSPTDVEVPATSAAIFDEQALDPYEVYESAREAAAEKAGRP